MVPSLGMSSSFCGKMSPMAAVMYRSCLRDDMVWRNSSSLAVGGVRRCFILELSRSDLAKGSTLFISPSAPLVMTVVTSNKGGASVFAWTSFLSTEAAQAGVPKKATVEMPRRGWIHAEYKANELNRTILMQF